MADRAESAWGVALWRADRMIGELFHFSIELDQHISEWFESAAEHGVICLEGSLRVEFHKHDDVTLNAGDALFYRDASHHRWHVDSNNWCRTILIGTTR